MLNRVLLIIPQDASYISGVHIHVSYLSKYLTKKGYEVSTYFSYMSGQKLDEKLFSCNRTKFLYSNTGTVNSILDASLWLSKGDKLIRKERPHLIHFHGVTPLVFHSKLHNIPSLATNHGLFSKALVSQREFSSLRIYNFMLYRFVDKIIAVRHNIADDVLRYFHVKRDKVRVVLNGVDTISFRPFEVDSDLTQRILKIDGRNQDKILLFVKPIEPRNLHGVLKALHFVKKANRSFTLAVVWDKPSGEYGALIESLIKKFSLKDNVVFTGKIPYDYMPYVYNSSDMLMSPYLIRGLSLTILEAMACGVPVISSNTVDQEQIINNVTGCRVDPHNPHQIADKIIMLLEDEGLCKRIGDAAKRFVVENFSWDVATDQIIELYRETMDRR